MRRSSRRRGQAGTLTLKSIAATAGLLAFTAIIAVLWWKSSQVTKVSSSNLCPAADATPRFIAVLLDVSDGLSRLQIQEIRNILDRERIGAPKFTRFAIYSLASATSVTMEPSLELCNPGDTARINELYQNPSFVRRRWAEFSERLTRVVDSLLTLPPSDSSPIMEGVQGIATKVLGNPAFDHAERKLIIVSDLLQYSSGGYNMYREVPVWASEERTSRLTRHRAKLPDVRIAVLYIDRARADLDRDALASFWGHYFTAAGATMEAPWQWIYGER